MIQRSLFYFSSGVDLETGKEVRGQSSCRHLQLSGSLAWPKAEHCLAGCRGNQWSFIRKTAAAEWPVINAVIESSVIFTSLWLRRGLIAMHSLFTSHFRPFISNKKSDFERKTMFFFQASFACQALPMEPQSVARGESQSGFEGDLSHLPWDCPGERPQGGGVQAMAKLGPLKPNPPLC